MAAWLAATHLFVTAPMYSLAAKSPGRDPTLQLRIETLQVKKTDVQGRDAPTGLTSSQPTSIGLISNHCHHALDASLCSALRYQRGKGKEKHGPFLQISTSTSESAKVQLHY